MHLPGRGGSSDALVLRNHKRVSLTLNDVGGNE